ncbi:MAG: hypothetical protein SF069_11185, partial [Phycisphaerae bacterium]|nr:hypothetical protein [Phycisphaerae bacterium]
MTADNRQKREDAPSLLTRLSRQPATTAVLATVTPTLFVLSQNWYALSPAKSAWLVAAALVAGIALAALISAVSFLAVRAAALFAGFTPDRAEAIRNTVFGIASGFVVSALLYRSLQGLLPIAYGPIVASAAIIAAIVAAFFVRRHDVVNRFLAIFAVVACVGWATSVASSVPPNATALRRDFERAKFASKPNIYLFIYDAYGSRDVYERNFSFDNSAHYAALEGKGFKVLHG